MTRATANILAMSLVAIPVATGLGYLSGGVSGAWITAVIAVAVLSLTYVVSARRRTGRPPDGARSPRRFLRRNVVSGLLALAAASAIATGIAWLVSGHASGGGLLIGAGTAVGLSLAILRRYGDPMSGRR